MTQSGFQWHQDITSNEGRCDYRGSQIATIPIDHPLSIAELHGLSKC